MQIAEDLIGYPKVTAATVASRYNVTGPGAYKAVARLVELGVLEERTGKKYGRVFEAREVMRIIQAD